MAGIFSSLPRIYLALYNWIAFFGWLQVFYLAVKTLKESGHHSVYAAVEKPLVLVQTSALLEVLHSLIGIFRSPISTTFPQVIVTWGVLHSFPPNPHPFPRVISGNQLVSHQNNPVLVFRVQGSVRSHAVVAAVAEVQRTFLILYPTGISSEIVLIYNMLPYVRETGKYSTRMPNKWNWAFDYYYFGLFSLACYVPGTPHLYWHMLSQRRKALSKPKTP